MARFESTAGAKAGRESFNVLLNTNLEINRLKDEHKQSGQINNWLFYLSKMKVSILCELLRLAVH